MASDGIAYQNKDIISKFFADTFGEKSLNVYGLDLPKVKRLLPTSLPAIAADERRIDELMELEDGSIAIVDYESKYREDDKIKYAQYLVRVATRYQKVGKQVPILRMVVIYTADVKREQVNTEYNRKGIVVRIEPAFLSELNSEEIRARLNAKVKNGEKLTDEELMEFIILPLSYETREKKQEILKEAVTLAQTVTDRKTSIFLLSGLLVFSDKIVDAETRNKVEGWIRMTQIEQMWWERADAKYAPLLAAKDAALKARDKEAKAALKAKDKEAKAALKAKDKEAKAALKAKDKEIEAALEAKEQENARTILHVVDSVIRSTSVALEDALRMTGFSASEYANAQALLGQTEPLGDG